MAAQPAPSITIANTSPSRRNMDAPSGMRRWVDWANILSTVFPKAWPFSRLMREKSSSPNSMTPPCDSQAMSRSMRFMHSSCVNSPVTESILPLRSRQVTTPANIVGWPFSSRFRSPRHITQILSPKAFFTWYSRSWQSVSPESMRSIESSKRFRSRSTMSSLQRGMRPGTRLSGRSKSSRMLSETSAISRCMSMMYR